MNHLTTSKIVNLLISFVLTLILATSAFSQVDKAYAHLYKIMDQYHETFDVYTDSLSGGDLYYPAYIGNWEGLELTQGNDSTQYTGWSCLDITYDPSVQSDYNWAGIQWLFPDTNWGYWNGRDLTGAVKLSFWAKGKEGGEKVEFKVGGVNRLPLKDSTQMVSDSYDLRSTGVIKLENYWKEYSINLLDPRFFAIYLNGDSRSDNRYFPTGWMNVPPIIFDVDPNWSENPCSGSSCFKVEWNGFSGNDGGKWGGIQWQYPAHFWDSLSAEPPVPLELLPGYNLEGATKLSFWARTDPEHLGLKVQFAFGDNNNVPINYWQPLGTDWAEYTIDLTAAGSLNNIHGGFAFFVNDPNDPEPDGCVFYLDSIQFDLPLSNVLSNMLGGFVCAMSEEDNPNGCSFSLDNIRFELSDSAKTERKKDPHFLLSYVPLYNNEDYLFNAAYSYDNALAMLAFMSRGTEEDWERAEILGRSFIYCQENDYDFSDFRLRNGYRSGELINPLTQEVQLPFFGETYGPGPFNSNTHVGNMAWPMIAMLTYYDHNPDPDFLTSAINMGEWIMLTKDTLGYKGYRGGFEGYGQSEVLWKSIEHNIDVYVAFQRLYQVTQEQKWLDGSMHAKHFIEAMWNPNGPFFWVGTTDTEAINDDVIVEDAQSWALMALLECPYSLAIEWAKENLLLTHDGYTGFDFDTDLDGVWLEGTAHMAIACLLTCDTVGYGYYLEQLRQAQMIDPNTDTLGIVAACHDEVSTGFDWTYSDRLHAGATAWYIFAENAWNPYWGTSIDSCCMPVGTYSRKIDAATSRLSFFPNPFIDETTIRFYLSKPGNISVKIFDLQGQLVRVLTEGNFSRGDHELHWEGKYEDGRKVPKGIYFVQLSTSDYTLGGNVIFVE